MAGEKEFAVLYIARLGKASLLKGHLSGDLNEMRMASHVGIQKSILVRKQWEGTWLWCWGKS